MNREEAIANLNMISVAFVDPVTKEQRKLIDDTFDIVIKALEQEPCEDAIDRKLVCAFIAGLISDDGERRKGLEYIRNMPPVNPTKTGHWIEHPEIETSAPEYLMFYECSECGDKQCFCKSDIHKKRFCGNCGCRMEEPQERSGEE